MARWLRSRRREPTRFAPRKRRTPIVPPERGVADAPRVVVGGERASPGSRQGGVGAGAGMMLAITGIVFLVGTAVDLGVLWILQRQETIQWEFVALTRTMDGFPRLVLAAALLYAGMSFTEGWNRTRKAVSSFVVVLGLAAGGIGVLIAMDYTSLAEGINEQARPALRSSALKTLVLSGLHFLVLLPAGVIGFRKVGHR